MRYRRVARKREQKQIAAHRIAILEHLADDKAKAGDLQLAKLYVDHAFNIGTRLDVRLPSSVKRRLCKTCGRYLQPGVTSRTRIHRGRVILYCTTCGTYHRYPLHHRPEPKKLPPAVQ